MKNGLMPVRKSTWRSSLDLEYLDEQSAVKQEQMERYQREIGKKLRQFNDYASKEKLGEVHVAGFLHDAVARNPDGTGTSPGSLSNEERKRRITAAWMKKLKLPVHGRGAKKDVLQHRLVFSMSTELYDRCVKAGVNPDKVLHHSMKKVMRKFQEQFHPGDRISYAYGFHHDTDNPHVHVALCPRTAGNKYVGYSTPKISSEVSGHRDQYGFMQKAFEQECHSWGETLSSPEKIRELKSQKQCEEYFFHRRYTRREAVRDRERQPESYSRISQTQVLLNKLRQQIEDLESEIKIERMTRLVSHCFGWRPLNPKIPLTRSVKQIGRSVRREKLKSLRESYFKFRAIYHHELNLTHHQPHERSAANRQANYQRCQSSYSRNQSERQGIRV